MTMQACEACLTRPALGVFTLHTQDGHHVADWWTCGPCADHDAPIHDARGLAVSVLIVGDVGDALDALDELARDLDSAASRRDPPPAHPASGAPGGGGSPAGPADRSPR